MDLVVYIDQDLGLKSIVRVMKGASIKMIKEAIAKGDPLGQTDPESFALRLLESGAGALPLGEEETITDAGTQLHFCSPAAASGPTSPADAGRDLEVVVHIDRALGLQTSMTLRPGATVRAVKEQLAREDPTGNTKPDNFSLSRPGAGVASDDSERLTEADTEFDVSVQ